MKSESLKPTIITSLKTYTFKKFLKDTKAGIMVAVIALPLSIALAIASGVRPENGLYSAIIGGLFVSMLSGSNVQIGGITAATVMTVATIVSQYGMAGLAIASIMAGVFLIIMGLCKLGSLLKYIPITITTGFTAGIAIGIFTSQMKDFFGLQIEGMPVHVISKWEVIFKSFHTVSSTTCIVAVCSLAILVILSKISKKIPNELIMVLIMTSVVNIFKLPIATIRSVYGELPSKFPPFHLPQWNWDMIQDLFMPSFTMAILIGIVSLLSCSVTDGMIGKRHHSNMELIAEGVANIFCGLFHAVPVAGAVARSSNSVKNGGKSQIAGIVHSITVCIMLLVFMPLIGYIPMPSLAALLIVVACRMINWSEIYYTLKYAPKSDAIVLFATIFMAVLVDLMTAVEVGILLTALLFMKRMADVTTVEGWKYLDDDEEKDNDDSENLDLKVVPKHTQVYEVCGPMFFAASDKLLNISPNDKCRCLIIRMRSVSAIDATAMHRLEHLYTQCKKRHITMILSHVNEQPMEIMKKSGFDILIGENNFCPHIDDALKRSEDLH